MGIPRCPVCSKEHGASEFAPMSELCSSQWNSMTIPERSQLMLKWKSPRKREWFGGKKNRRRSK